MNPHSFGDGRHAEGGALRMKVEECLDREEWRRTARLCSYATFFHTPDWYQLFARTDPGMQIRAKKIIFSDGKKAILPLMKIRSGRFRSLYLSGPAGVYGGWISGDDLNEPHVYLILSYIRHEDSQSLLADQSVRTRQPISSHSPLPGGFHPGHPFGKGF